MTTLVSPLPYGFRAGKDGAHRCVNSWPGAFGHECGKQGFWIGRNASGHEAIYCDACAKTKDGEARGVVAWQAVENRDSRAQALAYAERLEAVAPSRLPHVASDLLAEAARFRAYAKGGEV